VTVKELIEELAKVPPGMKVISDLHSEFAEVQTVKTIAAFENGGYVSSARYARDNTAEHRVHGFVYVGVSPAEVVK